MRGESENRNKEFKRGFGMDRPGDHRFLANFFRLYPHAAAMNLVVRLRREVADPPAASELPAELRPAPELSAEALPIPARKAHANARRRRDPLGEAQPET